ncbi:MAG: chloride channel protein [Phycisphaerales bacterium]|nr:chloride channel protein [Phycisphaerales bacterium]
MTTGPSESGGVPVSPILESLVRRDPPPPPPPPVGPGERAVVDRRVLYIGGVCVLLGLLAAVAAQVLIALIAGITNLAFYGRFSFDIVSPANNHLGLWVIPIPMIGGLIVGIMARWGSRAIRGHGIPETMERVLTESSRIPPRVTLLKPLSAAFSIGTGGPFGAEGPIIATGGALGSLLGQMQAVTAVERKTLLAAGAAAGMAATFGSPVAAVLLAVELLLFEFRARSLIPVALATTAATAARFAFRGTELDFPLSAAEPEAAALAIYVLMGAVVGIASVAVTRITYLIEEAFEHLPIHWMWWPVIGTFAVGVCGYFAPRTLGIGYDVIADFLKSPVPIGLAAWICAFKFISWAISLGSGTSGGTLAPLFTIGGGLGTVLGALAAALFPDAGIDPCMAALVGMAAMFAGASRAMLTAVVFAFEITLSPQSLLPLLGACAVSYLISALLMRESIMTAKLARRGLRVPNEYAADPLDSLWVRDIAAPNVITLRADMTLAEVRRWVAAGSPGSGHTGFPIITPEGYLMGVLTRRDLLPLGREPHPEGTRLEELLRRPPVVVYDDCTLRDATDHMVRHDVGRLPVISRLDTGRIVGIITRSNILAAQRSRLMEMERAAATVRLPRMGRNEPRA